MTVAENFIIADSNHARRLEIEAILGREGFEFISFANAWDLMGTEVMNHAGVMILDFDLEGLNALQLMERINQSGYRAPAIIVVGPDETHIGVRVMQLGAKDYLPDPLSEVLFLESILRLGAVDGSVSFINSGNPETDAILKRMATLSSRENEVVDAIENQMTSEQIAHLLQVSKSTVDYHRKNISRKMQSHNAADLMRMITLARNAAEGPD